MSLRPELLVIVQALIAREEPRLTLDMIAEAIGTVFVTVEDVDAIFRELESQNRMAEEAVISASSELAVTLRSARKLRMTLGRPPKAEEIARDANISVASVRSALLFAKILQR